MKIQGLVSVLIVTWNVKDFIQDCLSSLSKQSYQNIETIIVDNNSTDGSLEILDKYTHLKGVNIIKSEINLGFTGGNELALKYAKGDFILLLNPDTSFDKNLISTLTQFLHDHPKVGVVQPKLVFMSDHNKLDNVGAYLTWSGVPYYFGLYKSSKNPKYNQDLPVYSAKGACMLIRREVIDKVGFLDNYMFAYFEESDFCHRVWIGGYQCWYTPSVTVNHFVGATQKHRDNYKFVFFSYRNRIRSYLKNFEFSTLFFLIPVHLISIILFIFFDFIRGNFKRGVYIIAAVVAVFLSLPDILRQRYFIQHTVRKVKDKDINPFLFKSPSLRYYYFLTNDLSKFKD